MTRTKIFNWFKCHQYNTFQMLHTPLSKSDVDRIIFNNHLHKSMTYYVDMGVAKRYLDKSKKFSKYRQPISYCAYRRSARYYYWLCLYSMILENYYHLDIIYQANDLFRHISPDNPHSRFLYTIIDSDDGAYQTYVYHNKLKPVTDIDHLSYLQQLQLKSLNL